MASGLAMCRINRPNIWLHRPAHITKKYPCQNGAVHIWPFADERCLTAYEVEAEDDLLESDCEPPPLKWSDSKYGYCPRGGQKMGKRHKPEEIVVKLRQVDVLTSQGSTVADAIRQIGVTEITYYRWRKEFGGLQTNQVRRIKDLEQENARLRRAVSDLTIDKMILSEASKGNY